MQAIIVLLLSLWMPSQSMAVVSPTEAEAIFSQVQKQMQPILTSKGIEVRIQLHERLPRAGAFSRWILPLKRGRITVTSKLIKMKDVTPAVVAIMVCHEFGHFLGGLPYVEVPGNYDNPFPNLSTEGQSDFFSTAHCARTALKNLETPVSKGGGALPTRASRASIEAYCSRSTLEFADCVKHVVFVDQTIEIYRQIEDANTGYDIDPVDIFGPTGFQPTYPPTGAGEYPELICRAKTLLAGLECKEMDLATGRCRQATGADVELRPRCWFFEKP